MVWCHPRHDSVPPLSQMSAHSVRRLLSVPPPQLFDIAADVERYPEFVPWCAAARITRKEGGVYYTDQVMRLAVLRQRFLTKTVMDRPTRIDVTSDDPVFREFHIAWTFDPAPGDRCDVSLSVRFELRDPTIQRLMALFIPGMPKRLVAAFEQRARHLYRL